MNRQFVLCLDIGGTHISAAVLDQQHKRLHPGAQVTGAVDSAGFKEEILNSWDVAIRQVVATANGQITAILISIPGPFDYVNGISLMDGMHKYQSLLHMDIKAYFAAKYNIPADRIFFFNDAHAFLLGEVYFHRLVGAKVIGLTLGTGLGSAYYDGESLQDLNYGSAAFRAGIAEDYISTRGIVEYLKSFSNAPLTSIKELVENELYLKERELGFAFLSTALVDFIRQWILPLQPDTIILGGSISKAHALFFAGVKKQIPIEIKQSSFDDLNLFFGMLSTLKL